MEILYLHVLTKCSEYTYFYISKNFILHTFVGYFYKRGKPSVYPSMFVAVLRNAPLAC